ncbi:MAG: DUF368 domain-containing protein [Spirochaetaceae bacterium]|jgi:putative membrane protein|nr:DUF368 domain-containing protein [Spirochaetaceae bacterium]
MISFIKLFAIGIIVGIGNVIPGVSGGTLAVVFDIYDRLIGVITLNVKKILSEWKFWLPLGIGIVIGILLFSKLVVFLFTKHPAPARCFFIGIILGSIPLIFNRAKKTSSAFMPISASLCAIAALLVMFCMVFVTPEGHDFDVRSLNLISVFFLFVVGVIAAITMIIPGISGSFMLLALGAYYPIMSAISQLSDPVILFIRGNHNIAALLSNLTLSIVVLLPFGIGVIVGLLVGAALVRALLEKIPRQTYGTILGLITGSIFVIYPQGQFSDIKVIAISIACLVFGAGLSLCFSRKEAA